MDSTTADIVQYPDSETTPTRFMQVPFRGGFEDIVDPVPFSSFSSSTASIVGRQRSLVQTLLRYFTRDPPGFDARNPTTLSLSYYSIKTITSEWMLYTSLMGAYVKHYEYVLFRLDLQLQSEDLNALQPWRRRSKRTLHGLRLMQSFIERHHSKEVEQEPWIEIIDDIRYLSSQVAQWALFLESMVPMATSMLQVTDTRRSLMEAANVKRLTYGALVFIPLSFVAGLFSMSEKVPPWSEHFWVYFAVAVPLVLLVLGIALYPFKGVQNQLKMAYNSLRSG